MPSCTACRSVPFYHLAAQANIRWGYLRDERQRDPRRCLWKPHTELTLLPSLLAALHPPAWRSQLPLGSPEKEQDLGLGLLASTQEGKCSSPGAAPRQAPDLPPGPPDRAVPSISRGCS